MQVNQDDGAPQHARQPGRAGDEEGLAHDAPHQFQPAKAQRVQHAKLNLPLELRFELDGLEGAELDMGPFANLKMSPGQRLRVRALVKHAPKVFDGRTHPYRIRAVPSDPSLPVIEHSAVFYVPGLDQ